MASAGIREAVISACVACLRCLEQNSSRQKMQVTSTGMSLAKSRSPHLSWNLPVGWPKSTIAAQVRRPGPADNDSGAGRRKTGGGGVGGSSDSPKTGGGSSGSDEDKGPKWG